MAKVFLTEGPKPITRLAENAATFQQLCAGMNAKPDPVFLASFWDNLADDLGDFASSVTNIAKNIPNMWAAKQFQQQQPPQQPVQQILLSNPAILIAGAALLVVLLNKK